MKNGILFLIGLITLVSCNQEPDGFTIDGTLRGEIEEGTNVFLKKLGDNNQPVEVDTATITNGKFQFKGTAPTPELHYVFVDKAQGYTAVILENGTIDYSAQKDSLGFAKVKGTLQNNVFGDYLEKSRALSQQARSIQEDLQNATKNGSPEASIMALRDSGQLGADHVGLKIQTLLPFITNTTTKVLT